MGSPHLYEMVKKCVELGVYDKDILKWYNKSEFDSMNTMINHDRDYDFTYAGLRQVMDKYLVQDRSTGDIRNTTTNVYDDYRLHVFAKYPKNKRLTYVKKYYNAISKFQINIPTPVMAGVRTL